MVADQWRAALAAAPHTAVVANADDPLVVWAAGAARQVPWVSAGLGWHLDAVGCPSCEGRITFAHDGTGAWTAARSSSAWPDGPRPLVADRSRHRPITASGPTVAATRLPCELPGRFNRANALDGGRGGRDGRASTRSTALAAMAQIDEVAGRFATRELSGVRDPADVGQEPGRVERTARPGGRRDRCRSWSASMRGLPTAPTRAGCGTCPSSGWPTARWWRPATAVGTSPCGCVMPTSPIDRGRSVAAVDAAVRGRPNGAVDVDRQLHRIRRLLRGPA